MQIGALGTCMKNRLQLSEEVKNAIENLQKGEYLYFESHNIMLSLFHDSKLVCLLSNVDKVKQTRVIRRKRKAK